jgi:hypothetical protein
VDGSKRLARSVDENRDELGHLVLSVDVGRRVLVELGVISGGSNVNRSGRGSGSGGWRGSVALGNGSVAGVLTCLGCLSLLSLEVVQLEGVLSRLRHLRQDFSEADGTEANGELNEPGERAKDDEQEGRLRAEDNMTESKERAQGSAQSDHGEEAVSFETT